MFASFNQQLPLPTRIVIGMSALLQAYWWAMLGGLAVGAVIFKRWLGTPAGRLKFEANED